MLVNTLAEREKKLIDLYAKGLRSLSNDANTGSISFLFQEIIQANTSVPVILTDADNNPVSHKNIYIPPKLSKTKTNEILKANIEEMKNYYEPIEIEFSPGLKNYIYYKNSELLQQLRYYPYIQLGVIFIFVTIGYYVVNSTRKAEQNRVWVGLAKETAHQLGTPLSSLLAWLEIFKSTTHFSNPEAIDEIQKDISRLETITARFSNIGSIPTLKKDNIYDILQTGIQYIKERVSQKVQIIYTIDIDPKECINASRPLLDWVIENIIKNAIDAMGGVGNIHIKAAYLDKRKIYVDFSDTGKGMPKNKYKTVFNPGYTTKQRGWGLGLTLSKRIVEEYHDGKIFVLNSEIGKGTTFRLILNRELS
ncbi:MAG: HAMP domain-containing sensor histidine kinase [Cytophagales bacterium]|nr:HAMP domain-containing sensor histidine kinase [Cytophagales bacterium]